MESRAIIQRVGCLLWCRILGVDPHHPYIPQSTVKNDPWMQKQEEPPTTTRCGPKIKIIKNKNKDYFVPNLDLYILIFSLCLSFTFFPFSIISLTPHNIYSSEVASKLIFLPQFTNQISGLPYFCNGFPLNLLLDQIVSGSRNLP